MSQSLVNDVPEDLLAKVCRSTPADARRLGLDLTPEVRVQLALFCYGRAHLGEHGLSIADDCEASDLVKGCGATIAASILLQLKNGRGDLAEHRRPSRPAITLAGAPLLPRLSTHASI